MAKKNSNKQVNDNQVINPVVVDNSTVETPTNETVETPESKLTKSLTVYSQLNGLSHGVLLIRQTDTKTYYRFIQGRIKTPTPQKLLTAIVRARLNVSIVDAKYNALDSIKQAGIVLDGTHNILNYPMMAYVNGDGKVNATSIFVVGGDCKSLKQATTLSNKQKKDLAEILTDTTCMVDGKLNFNAPRVKKLVDNIVEVYYDKQAHAIEVLNAVISGIDIDKLDNAVTEQSLTSKGAA